MAISVRQPKKWSLKKKFRQFYIIQLQSQNNLTRKDKLLQNDWRQHLYTVSTSQHPQRECQSVLLTLHPGPSIKTEKGSDAGVKMRDYIRKENILNLLCFMIAPIWNNGVGCFFWFVFMCVCGGGLFIGSIAKRYLTHNPSLVNDLAWKRQQFAKETEEIRLSYRLIYSHSHTFTVIKLWICQNCLQKAPKLTMLYSLLHWNHLQKHLAACPVFSYSFSHL